MLAGCNCGSRLIPTHVWVEVSPRSLDFGTVSPGTDAVRMLKVTAHGQAVHPDALELRDDARHSFSASGPDTLGDESPVDVPVHCAPTSEGADAALLVLSFSKDGLDDVVVPLVGRAMNGFIEGPDSGTSDSGTSDSGTPPDAGAAFPDGGEFIPTGCTPMVPAAGYLVFDGGFCAGNAGFGHVRWPDSAEANLAELHCAGQGYASFFYKNQSFYGGIDALGELEMTTLRQVSPGPALGVFPRAARGKTEWGLVWSDDRDVHPRRVYFKRVSFSGSPVPNSEVPMPTAAWDTSASIAYDPLDDEWGVMWGADSAVTFVRLSATGALISNSQRTLSSTADSAYRIGMPRTLQWANDRYVAVWPEGQSILLQELDRHGEPVAASKTTVATATGTNSALDPAVAVAPGQYGVAWFQWAGSDFNVHFARVSVGGGLISGSEQVFGPKSDSPDVQWDGTGFFLAFTQQSAAMGQQLAIAKVGAQGLPGRVVTCDASGDAFFPRITWNGAVHAVAYTFQPHTTSLQEGRVLLIP
jgi:hypothetical protein